MWLELNYWSLRIFKMQYWYEWIWCKIIDWNDLNDGWNNINRIGIKNRGYILNKWKSRRIKNWKNWKIWFSLWKWKNSCDVKRIIYRKIMGNSFWMLQK